LDTTEENAVAVSVTYQRQRW